MNETQEALRLLRSQSLSTVVRSEIENRILSGDIAPGARVNEYGLAKEIGVSRGPIREACRGLVEMGLLTFVVNRGFFVREITQKDASELYEIRASLMRLAGETLARRITDAELNILARLVADMDVAVGGKDFEDFYAFNREFHDRIVDLADNDRLKALCDGLSKELHLYRRRSLLQGGGFRVSNREHKKILAALRSRNPEKAGAALEAHVRAGRRRYFAATSDDTKKLQSTKKGREE